MIYTSYFSKLKNIPKSIIPISICAKAPKWYNGLQYKKLAPKYGFFQEWKKNHDNNYYIQHFYDEVLNNLDCEDVYEDLIRLVTDNNLPESIDDDPDIVLICYEKPNDFCHRHIVADWFMDNNYPYEIKEWEG